MSMVAPTAHRQNASRSRAVTAALLVGVASLALSGCIARTAGKIIAAPVNLGSAAVDKATTSQSEADRNRGREIRKREEKVGKLEREYRKEREKCDDGNRSACARAAEINEEIQELLPGIPADPDRR
ncbi:MAG: hypothetical protein AAF249_06880 [Pseudomonadota bacterium]